jgi:two-component system, OmpR family, sensor histidine kinase MtrB
VTRERRRFGVRARAAAAFGAMGLGVAIAMGLLTWVLARSYLVDQREDAARRQAYADARLTRSALRASDVDVEDFLTGLGASGGSTPIVRYREDWFAGSLSIGRDSLPRDLQEVVANGGAGLQRFTGPGGELHLGVGIALPAVDSAYFEVFPLGELERSLAGLRQSLVAGALVTSVAAAAAGRAVAGRVLRPLRPITATARRVAEGDLSARLSIGADPDLAPLTDAFNEMTSALEERIALEARFASDISHELRSPLAVLSASTEVIDRRRDQLPEVVASAFDMLKSRLATFQTLVIDLLEISRFDNRAARLELEPIQVEGFLRQLIAAHAPAASLELDGAPASVMGDRRRLGQALANICANASQYAGGVTAVTARSDGGAGLCIDVDDNGPGVVPEERRSIFDRFARGTAGQRTGPSSGSGLGLALVAEHLRLHGGSVAVLDAPGGGARFRLTIPGSVP